MKVYIAECVYDYEGSEILGVFYTKEKALEEGEKRRWIDVGIEQKFQKGDDLQISEWEVEE